MATRHTRPQFWDRETDLEGKTMRPDVRLAAREVWPIIRREVYRRYGDDTEAAEIIERAVLQTSTYLDRIGAGALDANKPALLLTISRRLLRRRAPRWRCFQSLDRENWSDPRTASWEADANSSILLREFAGQLSKESARVLTLRIEERTWRAIAATLNTTVPAVKNRFWREIGNLKTTLSLRHSKGVPRWHP